jgi:hypothetical protein
MEIQIIIQQQEITKQKRKLDLQANQIKAYQLLEVAQKAK